MRARRRAEGFLYDEEKKEPKKSQPEQEWKELEMRDSEKPQDYIARAAALRRLRLASIGTSRDVTGGNNDKLFVVFPSISTCEISNSPGGRDVELA